MIRVIEFLREARGWRRAGLALTSGMIAALSMPPFDFWPLLFVAFPVVLLMLEGIEKKLRLQSFFLGWCFGFGYFIVALHWIGFAFFVDADDLFMDDALCGGRACRRHGGVLGSCSFLRNPERAQAASSGAGFCRSACRCLNGCAARCLPGFPGPRRAWPAMAWGRLPRRPHCGACRR